MSVIGQIIEEELKKYLKEMTAPYEVIENGVKVFWKYNRKWFDRVLEGTAYGVLTGKCTEKKAEVELTTPGPDGREPGNIILVAITKLRTVGEKKKLITPAEYEKKIGRANDANIYND